jgi:hypothetical protein
MMVAIRLMAVRRVEISGDGSGLTSLGSGIFFMAATLLSKRLLSTPTTVPSFGGTRQNSVKPN